MAGVTRPDDRGQLLLVGAFGLAVLLVVLAGVVNSAAYTDSLTTSTGDLNGGRDVAAFRADAGRAADGILGRVNDGPAPDYAAREDRFRDAVDNWSDAAGRQHAMDGTGVGVSVVGTTRGSRITQSTARPLTNASGTADWTVAAGVSDVRRARLNLSQSSLLDCGVGACYELVADDGTDVWRVTVGRLFVTVDGPAGTEQCAVTADPVVVDFRNETVNGDSCPALSFAEGLSTPYDIRIRNGDAATGTYRLTVDTDVDDDDGDFAAAGEPSVTPVVYAADVRVSYRTPRLTYATELRVDGGESDG
ncbi:DUF7261 family protein [Halorarius halobius]|uniref:DUF7261 family protein n=1 Tax=Halorarius halobius TaxID=2962671 RepID=UPI0020CC0F34|nr:hypothetical protein [Halorarius halobius]